MTSKKRVLLRFCGGRDSFVATLLLRDLGYEPIGITFIIKQDANLRSRVNSLVQKLAIEHYFIDIQDNFEREIIHYFIDGYLNGLTPNPCVRCNQKIKWPILFSNARELNCDFVRRVV
jgi:tRNA-specific 2-thiouridylase